MKFSTIVLCMTFCRMAFAGEIVFDFDDANDAPAAVRINQTPPRTVELLASALVAKPVATRRVELVMDLGECGLPSAVAPLVAALSDDDSAVRSAASRSLGKLGDKSVIPHLIKAFEDSDTDVRIASLQAVAGLGDDRVIVRGLRDRDERMFVAACRLTPSHGELIIERLGSLGVDVKAAAIMALARLREAQFAPVIASHLADQPVSVTIAAIEALSAMKAVEFGPQVQALATHSHPSVRRASIMAILVLCDVPTRQSAAATALGDPDLSVRATAANVLSDHPDPSILPQLIVQLAAGDATLNAAARRAIVACSSVDQKACLAAAVKLLGDNSPRRREDGSYLLGAMKSDAEMDRHIALLNDADARLVRQVARSLGQIGDKSASAELLKVVSRFRSGEENTALSEEGIAAVAEAFVACGLLGEKSALPLSNRLIPEKLSVPVEIRVACIFAAGVLADENDDATASLLMSVLNDNSPFEVERARIEAARALVNQHRLSAIETLRREGSGNLLPALRFACHQAADALSKQKTEYKPPEAPFVAETCIQHAP